MAQEDVERTLHGKIESSLRGEIRRAFRALLERKYLYQRVSVELKVTAAEADQLQTQGRDLREFIELGGERVWIADGLGPYLKKYAVKLASDRWNVIPELQGRSISKLGASEGLEIVAPPAELYCRECRTVKTHNSGSLRIETTCPAYPVGEIGDQVFTCGYECQSCRSAPIVFQITRRGLKLTLTGCSEYPKVAVPRDTPEHIEDYISEAIVAAGTGRVLAALFFLRTAVEQHMRLTTGLSGRQSGDELAAAYRLRLPARFPSHEWVLGRIYEELSGKLHSAEADPKQYAKSLDELERFFAVQKLYPLTAADADPPLTP